ncbi:MAG TPA: ABC transporter permease, partial [Acidobacteriota bacterium]|nr:ABC transporter permease [Acidobacteriota bacterium]
VPAVFALILQQTLLIGIGIRGGGAREDAARVVAPAPAGGAREDAARGAGGAAAAPAPNGGAAPRSLAASASVVLGRAAAYCALYFVHVVFYFGVVCPLHGFGGAPDAAPRVLAFTAPFIVAVTFLGLACADFWPRRETALQTLMFTSIPAAFLAGFAWPAQAIPLWLRAPAALIPSTTGIAGLVRVLRMGARLPDVAWEWGILWALAALYFSLAVAAETRRG